MNKSLATFIKQHYTKVDGCRLGQRFIITYISEPWPELFYEKSDREAIELIQKYLTDLHYFDKMPVLSK
jgi:hypothetical protein